MVEKVTIIKKLARIGISLPLFLIIIIVWVYFTIKAAQPQISDTTDSLLGTSITNCDTRITQEQCEDDDVCLWAGSECVNICYQPDMQNEDSCNNHDDCEWKGGACQEDTSWHPFDTFCQAQATSAGQAAPTAQDTVQSESMEAGQPCQDPEQTRYNCGNLPDLPDLPNVNIDATGFCTSGKYPDSAQTWCDDPNLPDMTASDGTSILSERAKLHCCKDHIYESNINYIGLFGYLLLTLPFVYFLIEKIIAVFIYYRPNVPLEESQFEFLGTYISDNGAKYVAWGIAIYYLILPIFRFIFVSYKCEDVNEHASENCGKPCDNSSDCATLHGSGCVTCVNNVCESADFQDGTINSESSNIGISVCGLKSILYDLSNDEINELYNKHVEDGSSTDRDDQISEIESALSNDETHRQATSEFYKFMPRQEIAINDTSAPFRVVLPNPTSYTATTSGDDPVETPITGFNYILNNYLYLEDYTAPEDSPYCSASTEILCNKNHNCEWVDGVCNDAGCTEGSAGVGGRRYSLPDISGINSTQSIGDLPLHDKVIRGGREYNIDNMYPCNDVVISQLQKTAAKSSLFNSGNLILDSMSTWINHFELNRVECADKQGQCYMDDYVCKTKSGVPIPLKYITSPVNNPYTIGKVSDLGCQSAMYPCQEEIDPCNQYSTDAADAEGQCTSETGYGGQPCIYNDGTCSSSSEQRCTALRYDLDTGYLLESADGGNCTPLVWDVQGWREATSSDTTDSIKNMCVPDGVEDYTTIPEATAGTWVSNLQQPGSQIESMCKSVKRVPSSRLLTSNTNPYYRWSAKPVDGYTLCSDSGEGCSDGTILNQLGSYMNDMGNFQDNCCISSMTTGPQSLYVTAEGGDAQALGEGEAAINFQLLN